MFLKHTKHVFVRPRTKPTKDGIVHPSPRRVCERSACIRVRGALRRWERFVDEQLQARLEASAEELCWADKHRTLLTLSK